MITLMLCLMPLMGAAEEPPAYSSIDFRLGPVPPTLDLRNMVRAHIVKQSCLFLERLVAKREKAFDGGGWQTWRDAVRKRVRADLGEMPFGPGAPDLKIRFVARHECKGFTVENVLFESLPGWDVNASCFLPDPAAYPPPWRGIVIPVGHSGKQMSAYQLPAQAFARMGYAAIVFDPPGMAGEKRGCNDHFSDGVRCHLTGESSNKYFIVDALRAIDYLATRSDIDMSRGVGMTGVSGGGYTTMFATLLDDRIAASGPACTAVPNAMHPVLDCYAPCVETLAAGRFNDGYDDVDLLAAAAPTPLLLMAGAKDEVFKSEWSDRIAAATKHDYTKAGEPDRFAYFSDPGGHDYTLAMAVEFAKWMDRWIAKEPDRPRKQLDAGDVEMLPEGVLECKPRLDADIFTLNRDRAAWLRAHRSGMPVVEAAARLAHLATHAPMPECRPGERTLVWHHWLEEWMLAPESGIELPATFIYPARDNWRGGALLYFDEGNRWADLRGQGMLASLTHFADKDTSGPAILTVELRGWGDTKPANAPYDVAGWADRERWVSYVSAALGDSIFSMRVRDGLSALAYLAAKENIEPGKIIVAGRGAGAVVAMHVAALAERCKLPAAGLIALEPLGSFEQLATAREYAWSHETFYPGVLVHYDLPELVRSLKIPALILNPLDAAKARMGGKAAAELYGPTEGSTMEVKAELDGTAALKAAGAFISARMER